MKAKLLLTSFLLYTSCICFSQAPTIQWQKTYSGSDDDQARAIQQTKDGGYIVAGFSKSTNGQVTGHHGGSVYDYWLVKTDVSGNIQWQKSYGGTNFDIANSVQQTTDGGYIIAGGSSSQNGDITFTGGYRRNDYWIVKTDATGNIIWQKTLGGSGSDVAQSVSQTIDGGYIIAGSSYSTNGDVTGNHGNQDYWIVKLNANGGLVWQKALGGTGSDVATSAQQTADGGYIVCGFTSSNNGNVTGNHGATDYWVVKLNSTGNLLWQKTYGGSSSDDAYSIKQSADGGYFVAGQSSSTDGNVTGNHGSAGDYWVIKLNAAGSLLWQKALGGTDYDIAFNLSLTNDGGCVVAGTARSVDGNITKPRGDYDYWLTKLNSSGTLNWQLSLGGSDYDEAYAVQQTADSGYVVAGFTFSNDGDVTLTHGNYDFWVVKLKKPSGKITSQQMISTNELKQLQYENDKALSVYKPNNNSVTIDLNIGNENDQPAFIQLIDPSGRIISTNKIFVSKGVLHHEMHLQSKFAEGIYLIHINIGANNYTRQFIYRQ